MTEHTRATRTEAIADSATRRDGLPRRRCACGAHTVAGTRCAACSQKTLDMQRKPMAAGASHDPVELAAAPGDTRAPALVAHTLAATDEEMLEKSRENAYAQAQGSDYTRDGKINCAYEGYEAGDPRRHPNVEQVPMSAHVVGRAIDLSGVEWNKLGGDWSDEANRFVASFGLSRPFSLMRKPIASRNAGISSWRRKGKGCAISIRPHVRGHFTGSGLPARGGRVPVF